MNPNNIKTKIKQNQLEFGMGFTIKPRICLINLATIITYNQIHQPSSLLFSHHHHHQHINHPPFHLQPIITIIHPKKMINKWRKRGEQENERKRKKEKRNRLKIRWSNPVCITQCKFQTRDDKIEIWANYKRFLRIIRRF